MAVFLRRFFRLGMYVFSLIGLLFVGMFFAVRFHLTDVGGKVDILSDQISASGKEFPQKNVLGLEQRKKILSLESIDGKLQEMATVRNVLISNYCSIRELGSISPYSARNILLAEQKTGEPMITRKMVEAAKMQMGEGDLDTRIGKCTEDREIYGELNQDRLLDQFGDGRGESLFLWANGEVWDAIKAGIMKDRDSIYRAASRVDLEPRMLLVGLVGEQIRLFNSQRELVKKFFAPLKILGNANKISLGVMGIKEATAQNIRAHLKDKNSEYYLGPEYEQIVDVCPIAGKDMYACLTSEEDGHYLSYLYAAVYMKQILSQWQRAGFYLQYRPEILGTLYNVGFPQSRPKSDPKVGGSTVRVEGKEYTFGRIAYEFYYSGELLEEFPYFTDLENEVRVSSD